MKFQVLVCIFIFGFCSTQGDITVCTENVELEINETKNVTFYFPDGVNASVALRAQHGIVRITPEDFHVDPALRRFKVQLMGIKPGHVTINITVDPATIKVDNAFVHVTVGKSSTISLVSVIIGWIYFVAWSVSFYPQVYENWRRKSVVGLNFDFLMLNIIGFTLYSIFNCGLYWIPAVEEEYFQRHPGGLNPVQLNDIFFAVHAALVTVFTIVQCLMYERGGQSVSLVARGIVVIFGLIVLITMILSWTGVMDWLDFLYWCSYVKLTITLIKYIPQAVMNYKRKSTVGWSIGNVLLDFTGGILSMLQMIINADNYNDWESIFGDPTKFGLGLFSVLFDILFIIQHYALYRNVTGKEYDLSFQT